MLISCLSSSPKVKSCKVLKPPALRSIGALDPSKAASQAACRNSSLVSIRLAALAIDFSGDNRTTYASLAM